MGVMDRFRHLFYQRAPKDSAAKQVIKSTCFELAAGRTVVTQSPASLKGRSASRQEMTKQLRRQDRLPTAIFNVVVTCVTTIKVVWLDTRLLAWPRG